MLPATTRATSSREAEALSSAPAPHFKLASAPDPDNSTGREGQDREGKIRTPPETDEPTTYPPTHPPVPGLCLTLGVGQLVSHLNIYHARLYNVGYMWTTPRISASQLCTLETWQLGAAGPSPSPSQNQKPAPNGPVRDHGPAPREEDLELTPHTRPRPQRSGQRRPGEPLQATCGWLFSLFVFFNNGRILINNSFPDSRYPLDDLAALLFYELTALGYEWPLTITVDRPISSHLKLYEPQAIGATRAELNARRIPSWKHATSTNKPFFLIFEAMLQSF
ncbi:hypothetical protein J7T55_000389 [Diaporthe amygdali]|uniref:uncharacterized protein n=1 Tax=Phomopsis amygdali TaxID=1214568 RepID=UPI0022FED3D8|nr:uncharacterized protein J7T55_000389 [Diaporthe amygdali]KAJ0109464.1 hypothetical protein J7T55_000389 [Diaporthe amygdali]